MPGRFQFYLILYQNNYKHSRVPHDPENPYGFLVAMNAPWSGEFGAVRGTRRKLSVTPLRPPKVEKTQINAF